MRLHVVPGRGGRGVGAGAYSLEQDGVCMNLYECYRS